MNFNEIENYDDLDDKIYFNILHYHFLKCNEYDFFNLYYKLSPILQMTASILELVIEIYRKVGKSSEAISQYETYKNLYGLNPDLEASIKETVNASAISPKSSRWSLDDLRDAFFRISNLNFSSTAYVLSRNYTDISDKMSFLVENVLMNCSRLKQISTYLVKEKEIAEEGQQNLFLYEDAYSAMLREVFEHGYLYFPKFSTVDQSYRGFTGTKLANNSLGSGSIDLCIKDRDNRIITIIEALIIKDNFSYNVIGEHIDKLFGYDTQNCEVLFMLSYGLHKEPEKFWRSYNEYLKDDYQKRNQNYNVIRTGEMSSYNEQFGKELSENFGDLHISFSEHQEITTERIRLIIHVYIGLNHSNRISDAKEARKKSVRARKI